MTSSRKLHSIFLSALLFGVLYAVIFSFSSYDWMGWSPATCMPNRCFCEQVRSGVIRQPMNTWSNLGFVLVGVWILWLARTPLANDATDANPMNTDTWYPVVYGTMTGVLGLGSLFYHASMSFLGQWMDVMGMYLVASFFLLYNLSTLKGWSDRTFTVAFLAFNSVLGYLQYAVPSARRWLFAVLVLVALGAEVWGSRTRNSTLKSIYLCAALVSLGVAFGLWWLDLKKIVCAPTSWFQLHSVWHLLCACTTGFVYLYYRSEKRTAA